MGSGKFEEDRQFWRDVFKDTPVPMEISSRRKMDDLKSDRVVFNVPSGISTDIFDFCGENGTSVFKTFLSGLYAYLFRATGKNDVVILTGLLNRPEGELEEATGMFVNYLPLKIHAEEDASFGEVLDIAKGVVRSAMEHQRYPYDILAAELSEKGTDIKKVSGITLAQQVVSHYPDDVEVEFLPSGESWEGLNIYLSYDERRNERGIKLIIDYRASSFNSEEIRLFAEHIVNIVKDGIADPAKNLYRLKTISESEERKLLCEFNDTLMHYPADRSFVDLFEDRVSKCSDNIAIVFRDNKLTYSGLNSRANLIAERLRGFGVGPDSLVCIMVEPSVEMITGIMGVLKAGGAYVPIDPSYPLERIEYILEDTKSSILLTQKHLAGKMNFKGRVICLDDEEFKGENVSNPVRVNKSSDLAYVIYTSGSTGKPKGVMIEHRSLVNFASWSVSFHQITEKDNIPKFASYSFDASIEEIFPALMAGATLHIIPDEIRLSVIQLNEYFEANNISVCILTTQYGEQFMEMVDNKSLRYLDTGGEKLRTFKKRDYQLVNVYGPTEHTVYTTAYTVKEHMENIPIGKPIGNTYVYIVDAHNNLQPIGVPGELCASGAGIARGYLNRPELTAEKFVDCPFRPGEKMYRTGDLARWLPDGNIEYMGRIDQQVKIRGFRIELGEIEQALLKQESVKNAVVIDREDRSGNKYLCAYIVSEETKDVAELKKELGKSMPAFMIPSHIIQIDSIPLTPNGKINRKALPEPSISTDNEKVMPRNETETILVDIWKEVLGVDNIGIDDDFFALGGHSLKATLLQNKIEKAFNVTVPLKDIFRQPTIRNIGEMLPGLHSVAVSLKKVEHKEYYPVSSAQKRLMAVQSMSKEDTSYNIPFVLKIDGQLDAKKLSNALEALVDRHESLRTSFDIVDSEPVQKVHKKVNLKKIFREEPEENLQYIRKEFIRPFDLGKAPLFRTELIKVSDTRHYLLLDFHHIVFDGTSLGVFLKELSSLYNEETLPELKYQYKDFAAWQNELLSSDAIKPQEEYWLSMFQDGGSELDLPTDHKKKLDSVEGAIFEFLAGRDMYNEIKRLSAGSEATLHMLLFAAFNVLLSKYSSKDDITVGTPVAGRRNDDLASMIGMFINTLPVRTHPCMDLTFREYLSEVRKSLLDAYDNQDYQLEMIVEKLGIKREIGKTPLFDVAFVLQNEDLHGLNLKGLQTSLVLDHTETAKFNLCLMAEEKDQDLSLSFEYRTDIYEEETIRRMSEHFFNIINAVAVNPDIRLGDINLTTEEEKYRLTKEFNDTTMGYPVDISFVDLFEDRVSKCSNNIAIVFRDNKLTYSGLNSRANLIAERLRGFGVGPDSLVCIMVEPSVEMITGIMGVLKAGGAYVPIDPSYPLERIEYILEDTKSSILLTQKHLAGKMNFKGRVICLDDEEFKGENVSNPVRVNKSSDLAYVIYTSGSTGKPKGVMIEHRSLVNFASWSVSFHQITEKDNIPKFASYSFDASIEEIFPALMAGATLHIIPDEIRLSVIQLNEYFEANNISVCILTTQYGEQFMEMVDNKSLRYLDTGGEKLRTFKKRDYQLVNVYGPTEHTVYTTAYTVKEHMENIPIGKPIGNTYVYIVDAHNNLQPIGVPGELCASGAGIARGYLNRPELTAEKFVDCPFRPGEKMYRTGDLARWLPDGNIEYMGRIDQQVKIRGFRIELGEIEQALLKQESVKNAVVIDREDRSGNKYLCAYIVSEETKDVAELKKELGKSMPAFMIPSHIIQIDSIPLTPNGKINRKALPEPDMTGTSGDDFIEPSGRKEERLAEVWKEVLGVERVGASDNFFSLGGHSLKVVSAVAKLQGEFEISVNDMFKYQTLSELASHISERKTDMKMMLKRLKNSSQPADAEEMQREAIEAYRKTIVEYDKIDLTETKEYRSVLLTGVTGYLGVHILVELLEKKQCDAYALVRGATQEDAEKRLARKLEFYFGTGVMDRYRSRLHVINGDISGEKLGLDQASYDLLASTIDCIIHPAANVKHYGLYREFYEANVKGTQNLLDFAKTGKRKDFNHVSTLSVAMGNAEGNDMVVFTEDTCDVGQEPDNYYVKTKLESEKLVIEARKDGLNASIYRAGNIAYSSRTGKFQENIDENGFYTSVKSLVNLGIALDEDVLDLSYVDMMSKELVLLFDRKNLVNQTYHLVNTKFINLPEALTSAGINIDVLKFEDFIDALYDRYDIPAYRPYVESLMLHKGWLSEGDGNSHPTQYTVLSERTDFLVKKLGMEWPDLDASKMWPILREALAQRILFLKHTPSFTEVPEESLWTAAGLAREKYYADESDIVWEGERDRTFYIIVDGHVELMQHSRAGWLGTIRVLGPGEFIGEGNIWKDSPSEVVAQALMGDARVLAFNGEDVLRLVKKYPEFGISLLREFSGNIKKLESMIVNMG